MNACAVHHTQVMTQMFIGAATGKRKKMGFREAFAEVHAANDEMRSLYVQLAASS